MALSKETQEWLNELRAQGNLSDEVIGQLRNAAEANPKADEFLKGSVLRQSDYSRAMSEVQKVRAEAEKAQQALASREAEVSKYQIELGQWKEGADQKLIEALNQREIAERKANATILRLQTVAGKYGIAEDDIRIEDVVPQQKKDETPVFDTSKYLTREDASKNLREAALVDAMLHDLDVEHQELYGTRLKGGTKLVEKALASGKPLTQVWEEEYKVPERRAAIQEETIQKRISEAIKAREAEIFSNNSLPHVQPGVRNDLHGSPVLKEGGIPAPPAESGGGISAAIAAFNSGKYSQRK